MATKIDSRQIALRAALAMVGSAAGDTLDTIFPKINNEVAKLFEDRNIFLVDGGDITFTGTSLTFTENLNLIINSRISGGGPLTISLGSVSRAFSASGRMFYAVVNRTAGTAVMTADATTLPAVTSANQEVFLIAQRSDESSGAKRIYFRGGFSLTEGQTALLGSAPNAPVDSMEIINAGITTSVAANALTIALKQADGATDATVGSPIRIAFRSSTAVTAASVERTVTTALTIIVPSGATLGTESGIASYVYLYAMDVSGTVELAVSGSNTWDERSLVSTTLLDANADSKSGIYSATARSNVPIRLLGRIKITEATAGTWASNATERYVGSFRTNTPDTMSIINAGITTSVAANALTVALKQNDSTTNGSDASPIRIVFRNSTAVNSTPVERQVTTALTIIVPSGATLGTVSAIASYIYIYALDNAGTVELAVSGYNNWDERNLHTTTVLNTSSDSSNVLYSAVARTNVPIRLIGRILITEATAGTWATNATELYVGTFNIVTPIIPSLPIDPMELLNVGMNTFVSGGTLNVALLQADGATDASPVSPVSIAFRTTVVGNQVPAIRRTLIAPLLMTVPSGATLGTRNGTDAYLYVYAMDNAGTIEMAIAGRPVDERLLQTTTLLDANADSNLVLYSSPARTSLPVRLIGRIKVNVATIGNWNANATDKTVGNFLASEFIPKSHNLLINSNAQIQQRQDANTAPILLSNLRDQTNFYFVDQFQAFVGVITAAQVSVQALTGDIPSGFDRGNSMKATSNVSGIGRIGIIQPLEDVTAAYYRGKLMSSKVWIKSNNAQARVFIFDTAGIVAVSAGHTGGGGWEEFEISGYVGTGAVALSWSARIASVGNGNVTITSGDYVQVYFPTLYEGLAFPGYNLSGGGTDNAERLLCYRYCYTRVTTSNQYIGTGGGQCFATNDAGVYVTYPVPMRISPTIRFSAFGDYAALTASGTTTAITGSFTTNSPTNLGMLLGGTTASGLVAGDSTNFRSTVAGAWFFFDAGI